MMPYADPDKQREYWRNYRRSKYVPVRTRKRTGVAARDLTGKRFGRLTVLWPSGIAGCALCWLCVCDCGEMKIARGINLRCGHTKSCGCLYRENVNTTNRKLGKPIHGLTGTIQHELWMAAQRRARKYKLPFNIKVHDVVIPEFCPLLGIKLESNRGANIGKGKGCGKIFHSSPSLDRIRPSEGYVKGNVMVISWRANTIKNAASLKEFELIAKNWRKLETPA